MDKFLLHLLSECFAFLWLIFHYVTVPEWSFSPPAISPPVSMVKPIVDSIHVYEYILMMLCCSAVILPLY